MVERLVMHYAPFVVVQIIQKEIDTGRLTHSGTQPVVAYDHTDKAITETEARKGDRLR